MTLRPPTTRTSQACYSPGVPAPILIDANLVTRTLDCELRDVVYVKSIAMAYDGLCCLFAEKRGAVRLVAPKGREAELDRLVNDLHDELAAK